MAWKGIADDQENCLVTFNVMVEQLSPLAEDLGDNVAGLLRTYSVEGFRGVGGDHYAFADEEYRRRLEIFLGANRKKFVGQRPGNLYDLF